MGLKPFFQPDSVAIVGASERATSAGGAVFQMMRNAGYSGRIIPVNPKGGEIFGMPVATSLNALDGPADLAVIAIRPDFIPAAVREAAESGHKNLLILPGGFSEAGEAGRAREAEVLELAEKAGITIAGPNCAGIIDLSSKTRLAATFLRDLPPGGGVAFISQSGALAEEVIASAQQQHIPVGTVVSVGNALHLGIEDYLRHLGQDDAITAILLYLESARDMDALAGLCREISRIKPVAALIPGRTGEGGLAAKAHTGADVKTPDAIEAFCRDAAIIRVKDLRELLLAAKGFGAFPGGFGRRALILSNSGGPGVLTTDRAILSGLELPDLPQGLADKLRAEIPPEASLRNPIDLLADAREDRFGFTLQSALELGIDAYDAILMIHVVPFMVDAGPVIDRLAELGEKASIPVMHSMMGTLEHQADWFRKMEKAGVPMFNNVEDMAETAGLLARYFEDKRL